MYSWSDEKYSYNTEKMDKCQEKLFELMDMLHTALAKRQGRDIISHVLDTRAAISQKKRA